jgi:aminopeptidase N
MREGQTAVTVRREDYTAPAFLIDTVDLTFDLDPAKTRVLNRMRVRRNPDVPAQALRLDGEDLNLARVLVNGAGTSFKLDGQQLVLEHVPQGTEPFDLEIFTTCAPEKNTHLMGLYTSQNTFFTQCEAQGFRRITYYLDRPDVMASFTVTLRAKQVDYPVLLSNGNLVEEGLLDEGRHFAKWVDPHKKPCYLFALVAGKLVAREQRITTRAGTDHLLQVYVRPGDLEKTDHAMQSLMASIAWDETRFGLPLDLERFMVVATSDFNMGAMENKGLNIFNTKFVLASPTTATDTDYGNIESVVAHEYFHNWTGNRVTCRDWFQLSLKEGLTVFRDQEFSQDMAATASARAVKRIEDVRLLRDKQFQEDAGPMAHPVRPDSYIEINNFYTLTVYEKGAELVRMMQTLVGRAGFAQGLKLYFARHDGQAVTCDDFAQAIADANPTSALAQHLEPFKRWYSTAGTPRVRASGVYDDAARTYTLTLTQSLPNQAAVDGKPGTFVIPVVMGLLGPDGQALPLRLQNAEPSPSDTAQTEATLVLTEAAQSWVFEHIDTPVVPSLLRGFSAPVLLEDDLGKEALLLLMTHDKDAFNRWEAAQRLMLRAALDALESPADSTAATGLCTSIVEALRRILLDPELDAAFKHLVLTLPTESFIANQLSALDPQRIHAVHQAMRLQLARDLRQHWQALLMQHDPAGSYSPDHLSAGKRALAGMAMQMCCIVAIEENDQATAERVFEIFKTSSNMTDRLSAVQALLEAGSPLAHTALQEMHRLFARDELVLDKWFSLRNPTARAMSWARFDN